VYPGPSVTSAATRAAMPRAKSAVSFILSDAVVSLEVCRWFGGMKVVGSCWLSVGFSGLSSQFLYFEFASPQYVHALC
jgi:hypothetical protein